MPAAQFRQVALLEAPEVVEYRPAVHPIHMEAEVEPMPVPYEPAGQATAAVLLGAQ